MRFSKVIAWTFTGFEKRKKMHERMTRDRINKKKNEILIRSFYWKCEHFSWDPNSIDFESYFDGKSVKWASFSALRREIYSVLNISRYGLPFCNWYFRIWRFVMFVKALNKVPNFRRIIPLLSIENCNSKGYLCELTCDYFL